MATLYRRFGIDLAHEFHDRDGRPIPILKNDEPITELFYAASDTAVLISPIGAPGVISQ